MNLRLFFLNLAWYVAAVIVVDLPPILFFFLMHRFGWLGLIGPQIIASALFFVLICGQAFLHLFWLSKRYPDRGNKNAWTVVTVTVLVFATFWLIIIDLIIWASNQIR